MAPTEKLGLRLPSDVAAWLRRRGAENLRSMAAEVTLLVRAEIKREEAAKRRKSKTA
jgi:hypothetical protein